MPVPERVRLLDRQASAAGTAAVEPTGTYSRRPVGRVTAPSPPENFHLPGRWPGLHERYCESYVVAAKKTSGKTTQTFIYRGDAVLS